MRKPQSAVNGTRRYSQRETLFLFYCWLWFSHRFIPLNVPLTVRWLYADCVSFSILCIYARQGLRRAYDVSFFITFMTFRTDMVPKASGASGCEGEKLEQQTATYEAPCISNAHTELKRANTPSEAMMRREWDKQLHALLICFIACIDMSLIIAQNSPHLHFWPTSLVNT